MEHEQSNERTEAAQKTSAPVAAGDVAAVLPEFIRVGDARKYFGLGRTYCYTLIREGSVRSVCIRRKGCRTGVRLLDVQSVRDFLHRQMAGASAAE